MSAPSLRSQQPGTDANVSPSPEKVHTQEVLTDIEKPGPNTISPTCGAFPSALVQPACDDIDDDDLFPEGGRGWLVVLGCFMLSS